MFYDGGLLGLGGFYFGGRRRGKASKPKKKKKENWFERLTVDQNKQLCKAAKLRHVGNKKDLIERLLEEEQTSKYACEAKYVGLNVEAIKKMCRDRGLQVSGNKLDLVLRILHCDNDSTPAGTTLKRAAADVVSSVDAATGQVVETHVPKKRKKPALTAKRIETRVRKKIEAVSQKKYQSHWGSKCHSTEVYDLVGTILSGEIERSEEGYLTKDPRHALSLAEAACVSLTDNFETMCRKGYDDFGGWSTIDSSLRTIVEAAKPQLSAEEREEAAGWIEDMYHAAEPYGLTMETELLRTADFLRGDDGKDDGEADDRKPAAVASGEAGVDTGGPKPAASLAAKKVDEVGDGSDAAKENVLNSNMVATAPIP